MRMLQYGFVNNFLAVEPGIMKTALLNTILGMGIVFIVLIFICLLISCFRIIPKIQQKMDRKQKAEENTNTIDQAVDHIVKQEVEEDLVGDTELVAVITAAIMASMGDEAPEDGLVVRSIRRVNRRR